MGAAMRRRPASNDRDELGERLGVVVADSVPIAVAGPEQLSTLGRILY